MRRQAGFTLIEMITVMVIMGIILTAGSVFFASVMGGLINSRLSAEIGPSAQLAMDRMAYEIKNASNRSASGTVGLTANTSFTYESSSAFLTGTRSIQISGTNLVIDVGGADHILLENVNNFTLGVTQNHLDGDTTNGQEISTVNISFQVTGYGGTFSLQVAPREFIRL